MLPFWGALGTTNLLTMADSAENVLYWGSWDVVHLITLIIGVGIGVGVYYLLKIMPEKARFICMVILSFSGLAGVIYDLCAWGSPIQYLPLHMCSITAILLPIAVLSKNKYIGNLLLIWCFGSLLALVFNQGQANYEIPSPAFIVYYFPHVFEFSIMVYLFKFKYIEKDFRCIPISIGLTMAIYTLVHLANLGINEYCIANNLLDWKGDLIQVNYMFSLEPTTPIFALFWAIIPFEYWYMYAAVLVLIVYLGGVYSPEIIRAIRAKMQAKKAAVAVGEEVATENAVKETRACSRCGADMTPVDGGYHCEYCGRTDQD